MNLIMTCDKCDHTWNLADHDAKTCPACGWLDTEGNFAVRAAQHYGQSIVDRILMNADLGYFAQGIKQYIEHAESLDTSVVMDLAAAHLYLSYALETLNKVPLIPEAAYIKRTY